MPSTPLPEIVAEARRLGAAAAEGSVPLRLIGGVAVRVHAAGELHPVLRRTYEDIDLVTTRKAGKAALRLLTDLGYVANDRFNAQNGDRRLVVTDPLHERRIDVFVGEFRMCHAVPLGDRLLLDEPTVPPAELLMTKLQVVQLNAKDLLDIYALLLDHDVADHDADAVNGHVVASVLASDWGFWRTSRGTVEAARARLVETGLDNEAQVLVRERLDRLWAYVEAAPKTLRWRSRARVGERTRWYEEPEEITHA